MENAVTVQAPEYLSAIAEFDAAVQAQRDARVVKLQKAASHFGWPFWIALGFGALMLGLMTALYFVNGYHSLLPCIGSPTICLCLALSTGFTRRRRAAQQLARELAAYQIRTRSSGSK